MYAISPAGVGLKALWEAARDGSPFGGPITRFDASRNSSQIGAEVKFDPVALGIGRDDVARMDRVTQFCLVASRAAIADTGLDPSRLDPTRAGVCIGTAIGGVAFMERVFVDVCQYHNGKPPMVEVIPDAVDTNVFAGFLAYSVSSEVALDNGFQGVCTTMATGCTAGVDAIGAAADFIAMGMADVMISGGADAPITPIVVTAFDNINCLTRRNDNPSKASRPFDRDRDGFLLAEGCGILVMESEDHARARGARIYGRVLGFASLSNAYHMTGLPADGLELAHTLRRALADARVNADEVDYINAHGSSTQQNDRNETAAFKTVFGERAYRVPISSTKSVIGHTLGAASALETIVCLCAISESVIPPTANYQDPDPNCDLDYVPNQPREGRIKVVECNASGFSGIHSAIILAHPDYQRDGHSAG
jgi:3-oxoacyl-(acyl-carrier-protein) synthase